MSEQNPTQKGKPPEPPGPGEVTEIPVVVPICPHCGRPLVGMNICEIILPTPQGDMTWLTACCPYMEVKKDNSGIVPLSQDGLEACGKVIATQFVGYKQPQIAKPGAPWLG